MKIKVNRGLNFISIFRTFNCITPAIAGKFSIEKNKLRGEHYTDIFFVLHNFFESAELNYSTKFPS